MTLAACTDTATRLVGAAPQWVRELMAHNPRQATVVHAGADAVYLDVAGTCVGILSSTATQVPCAVRTTLPSLRTAPDLAGARHGTAALVGDGRISVGRTQVHLGRVVDQSVPRLRRESAAWAAMRLNPAPLPAGELPMSALTTLSEADPTAVTSLLGRGGGLTPLGDDVLAGWLATMCAAGHSGRELVATETARLAPERTTLLSATLLACAAQGLVIPQFRRLVATLNAHGDPAIALARLGNVGHTSGAGLAVGMSLAIDLITRSN